MIATVMWHIIMFDLNMNSDITLLWSILSTILYSLVNYIKIVNNDVWDKNYLYNFKMITHVKRNNFIFMPAQSGRASKIRLLNFMWLIGCMFLKTTVSRTMNLFYTSDAPNISRKWLNSAFYIQFDHRTMLINSCSL